MSAVMALILLTYVVLCGGIAYIGDLLGRKMGKKRISLFGLRPRHTAVLITSFMGGMIAICTILIIITLNSNFRQLVTRGYETVKQVRAQSKELQKNEAKLKAQAIQLQQATMQTQEANGKRDAAIQQLTSAKNELTSIKNELTTTRNELQQSRVQIQQQQIQVRGLEQRRTILARQVEQKNEQVKQKNLIIKKQTQIVLRQSNEIQAQMTKLNDLTKENQRLAEQNEQYQEENRVIADQNLELNRRSIELTRNIENLNHANAELVDRNLELTEQTTTLANQKIQLAEQVEKYQSIFKNMNNTYITVREGRITYESGEEVARRTIACGIPAEEVKNEIRKLFAEAAVAAQERGAAADQKTVFVIDKRLPDGTVIDEQKSIDALAAEISQSTGDVVVIASAMMNTVEGEPVPVEMKPFRNRLVYSQGEEVAQFKLDSLAKNEQMFNALIEFLRQDVRSNAVRAGLIPMKASDGEFAPIGQIDSAELLQVMERLRNLRRPAVISAVAANDTYSGGPLRLTFKVKTTLR